VEEEQIQEDDEAEMKRGISKYVDDYEQRYDPSHPYCTNWPVNRKKVEHEKV